MNIKNLNPDSECVNKDKNDIKMLEKKHVYREEGIEKWSLVITP